MVRFYVSSNNIILDSNTGNVTAKEKQPNGRTRTIATTIRPHDNEAHLLQADMSACGAYIKGLNSEQVQLKTPSLLSRRASQFFAQMQGKAPQGWALSSQHIRQRKFEITRSNITKPKEWMKTEEFDALVTERTFVSVSSEKIPGTNTKLPARITQLNQPFTSINHSSVPLTQHRGTVHSFEFDGFLLHRCTRKQALNDSGALIEKDIPITGRCLIISAHGEQN